ncbi:hypothetical protein DMC47_08590 [Nostoc sp. 3335mG]|nr:hypothetical protein DMC47_08590 [Nostoc sp. 3335mG]
MHLTRHGGAAALLIALAAPIEVDAPAAALQERPDADVVLVTPFAQAPPPDLSSTSLGYKFVQLAEIDPDRPLADPMASQTLSLFGREDLIAGSSPPYAAVPCVPLAGAGDVLDEIEKRARGTRIVIVNESHERSEHRGFTAQVAQRLRPLGYDAMAIETLSPPIKGMAEKDMLAFIRTPGLPYFVDEDGFYLSEAGFGRLGRTAKRLGYRFVAYEPTDDIPADLPQDEQIARREEGMARTLADYVKAHPGARVLIHVGYLHAAEVPRPDGARWMAARLKEKTGIDPLTISQTSCRGSGETSRLSMLPAAEPAGTFDLVVDHPTARFERHRPVWRRDAGDRLIGIPVALRPSKGWRVIEARPVGEPADSVPMDRVAIRKGEDVALMLPPGRYHLRVIDPLRQVEMRTTPKG